MMMPPVLASAMVLAALVLALAIVLAAIAYARSRGMLDQPGQRRSHSIPTPRGGGIGVVIAVLATSPWALLLFAPAWPWQLAVAFALATVLVAAIGWWDDHHSLPVLPRLGVQLGACLLFGSTLAFEGTSWLWLPLLVLGGAWSINLHNFMDGIDGLLAQQGLFVAVGLAVLAGGAGQVALAVSAACLAAAALGFWCYNRPRAAIFMGDVGSGTLGFLLFAFTVLLWRVDPGLLWPAAILSSSFVTDATLTLLSRFLKGRRWYAPHREHLYQWLVRSGMSHAGGDTCYLAWNLLIAAPLAWLSWFCPGWGWTICAVAYLIAGAAWMLARRYCLWRIQHKARHVRT
ncbi:glycosyltransferase family 4 protein [Dyella marensis]|uniref:UDP-N-acetylmuramyl pentapeptide phosphotransferase/UDP-N-acetylglucosamine-1-phosphate transferase n=1 Tax=Dyella marensis TaxID=500610 RepID=A0A1I1XN14_9GAMM|nr:MULTISPECIES: glycosyltransferase family 4 protein [Dyella]SFE08716.1 UDP-N-acetylmuramyl pentapeptide phosphotransferase/UDP-N-acetylglucosamine-1-phosphate transferase [Dyella marensis]